jgi:hypothetical protein
MGLVSLDALRDQVGCADHPRDTTERRTLWRDDLANAHQCPKDPA